MIDNTKVNKKVKDEFTNLLDTFNFFKSLVYLAEFYPNEESRSILFNKIYELEHILRQNYTDIIKGVNTNMYDSVYYEKTICSECNHDLVDHNQDHENCNIKDCNCVYGYDQVLNVYHETIRVGKEVTKDEL